MTPSDNPDLTMLLNTLNLVTFATSFLCSVTTVSAPPSFVRTLVKYVGNTFFNFLSTYFINI